MRTTIAELLELLTSYYKVFGDKREVIRSRVNFNEFYNYVNSINRALVSK